MKNVDFDYCFSEVDFCYLIHLADVPILFPLKTPENLSFLLVNPLQPDFAFLYPLKTSENL